jgi:hypothetical protein
MDTAVFNWIYLFIRIAIGLVGATFGAYAFHIGLKRFSLLNYEGKFAWFLTFALLPMSWGWVIAMTLTITGHFPLYIDWPFLIATGSTLMILGSAPQVISKRNLKVQTQIA